MRSFAQANEAGATLMSRGMSRSRIPETRGTFIHNLQDLRDVADQYFSMCEEVLHRMPYGVRYLAQQMFEELRERFPV